MGLSARTFRTDKRDWVIFSLFLLLAFAVRLPAFFRSVLAWDEGLYLVMARSMVGGELPYVEVWDHKPPGIFALFALAQILLGDSVLSIRIFTCLAVAITSFILYEIGKLIGRNEITGFLAGILYIVFSLNSEGLAANSEIFYTVFVALAFFLVFRAFPPESLNRGGSKLLLAGLVVGIGLQINYLVAFDFTALLLIVGVSLYSRRREIDERISAVILKAYGLMSIGAILPFLSVILYFALKGHLQEYVHANFLANILYSSSSGFSLVDLMPVLRQQVYSNALLWVCLGVTPVYLVYARRLDAEDQKSTIALLVWSLMAILAIIITKRFYPHYFLHLLPPACLLSACLLVRILHTSREPDVGKQWLLLGLVVTVPLLQNIYPTLEMGAELVYFRCIQGTENWGDDAMEVARHLQARVRPTDYIYAVDYAPTIYYLVPARTPTKYVFPLHLIDEQNSRMTGVNPSHELASIIEKKPIYIVKQYEEDSPFYIELGQYLERLYVHERSINNVSLYRLRDDLE